NHHGADMNGVAFLDVNFLNHARHRRGDLHHRFVGFHFENRLIFGDDFALFDFYGQYLRLVDTLSEVRHFALYWHSLASLPFWCAFKKSTNDPGRTYACERRHAAGFAARGLRSPAAGWR